MGELGTLRVETSPRDAEENKAKAAAAFKEVAQAAIGAQVPSWLGAGGGLKRFRWQWKNFWQGRKSNLAR